MGQADRTLELELNHLRDAVGKALGHLEQLTTINHALREEITQLTAAARQDKDTIASLQAENRRLQEATSRSRASSEREADVRNGLLKVMEQLDRLETSF